MKFLCKVMKKIHRSVNLGTKETKTSWNVDKEREQGRTNPVMSEIHSRSQIQDGVNSFRHEMQDILRENRKYYWKKYNKNLNYHHNHLLNYFYNVHLFHTKLGFKMFAACMKSLYISLNIAHSDCNPCNFMSSLKHSPNLLSPAHLSHPCHYHISMRYFEMKRPILHLALSAYFWNYLLMQNIEYN